MKRKVDGVRHSPIEDDRLLCSSGSRNIVDGNTVTSWLAAATAAPPPPPPPLPPQQRAPRASPRRVHLRSLTNDEDAELVLATRIPPQLPTWSPEDSDGGNDGGGTPKSEAASARRVVQRLLTCTLKDSSSARRYREQSPRVPSTFQFHNYFTLLRLPGFQAPLPGLSWADSQEVWSNMMKKDSQSFVRRGCSILAGQRFLQARMRSILLDWMIEVCELYRLHRETFHLAVDFIDRYLSAHHNVQKMQLQLIGVTALFVAAKLEEVCPPKLCDFAFVTDGACTESDVLGQELLLLKALKWDLNPITIIAWLTTHLHILSTGAAAAAINGPVSPQKLRRRAMAPASTSAPLSSPFSFVQLARLLDLCLLDATCLQFSYSTLSAAALYHMSDAELATAASGYAWDDIVQCINWMSPFAITLREEGNANVKFFENVPPEDSHNIQTHAVDLNMLERAQCRMTQGMWTSRQSPDIERQQQQQGSGSCLLTPPSSGRKAAAP